MKRFKLLLSISLILITVIASVISVNAISHTAHTDANGDGACDTCGGKTDGVTALAGYNMQLSENVNFSFWFEIADGTSEDSFVEFKIGNRYERVSLADAKKQGDYRIFSAELAAKELGADIVATFVLADGTRKGSYTYSAAQYCKELLADSGSDNYKIYSGLVRALLNYSAHAQIYFGYNTDKLVNSGVFSGGNPIDSLTVPKNQVSTSGTLPAGLIHQGASLILESETTIRYYFVTDNNISDYRFSVDGKLLTPHPLGDGRTYFIDIEGITPRMLDKTFTVSVNDDYSVSYGALTYAYRQSIADDSEKELVDLVKALYLYSFEAEKIPSVLYYDVSSGSPVYLDSLSDGGTELPMLEKQGYEFDGWYKNESLTSKIDSLDSDFNGVVKAYGRYRYIFSSIKDGVKVGFNTSPSSDLALKNGSYVFTPTTSGQTLSSSGKIKGGSSLPEKAITYKMTLSAAMTEEGGVKKPYVPSISFRLRNSGSDIVTFLNISADGVVSSGGNTVYTLGTLSETPVEIEIIVDFLNQQFIFKDSNGEYQSSLFSLSANAGCSDASAWYDNMNTGTSAVQIRANSLGGSLIFHELLIIDGVDADLESKIEDQWADYYEGLRQENEAFENDLFGGSITTDMIAAVKSKGGQTYSLPSVNPEEGSHPRVMVNSDMLPAIKAAMENPANSAAVNAFWSMANSKVSGKLPPATAQSSRKGVHNFNYNVLDRIQAKAFAYLLTENEDYAYEALVAIKNYIITLDIQWIYSDQTREFGYVMYITACVYDWCYDILSEDDKFQLTAGIEHKICTGTTSNTTDSTYGGVKMEMGFPPYKQGAVSGHGSERQLLRDYLSFAIAIYDETPGWWDFIGGRFYEQYVPVRNEYYKSGMYPQGSSVYVSGRFISDLYSAVLIKALTGESPYSSDMKNVIHSIMAHETSDGYIFATGDGTNMVNTKPNTLKGSYSYDAILSSYVNSDPVALAIAMEMGNGFSKFGSGSEAVTPTIALICLQSGLTPVESYRDSIGLVTYNGGFLGQMITRNSWESDAAVTLMKVSERTTANHDHQAAGTFQIHYKGLLSGDTGSYDSYGTDQHRYFHQDTVAHNGLLVFNPALYQDAEYDENGNITNKSKFFYTGGQRRNSETSSLSSWMTDTYKTGDVIGYSYALSESGDTVYSYLSGDITAAYNSETVDYVGRSMLTVYTGDKDAPMVFFVFDRIDSDDASFKKTFLLQVPGENAPEIDQSAKTVELVNDGGRLVLQNIIGADKITPIGGKNSSGEWQNYLVNGYQIDVQSGSTNPGTWGRVEITSDTDSKTDYFFNVIYVTDEGKTLSLKAHEIDVAEGRYKGAVIGNVAALFYTDQVYDEGAGRNFEPIRFSVEGDGEIRYCVNGLDSGTWVVSHNGKSLGTVYATVEGGFVSFTASAGEITLTPASDVIGENTGRIVYDLGGGVLGAGAKTTYTYGACEPITTDVSRENCVFDGWYLDRELTKPVTNVPEDQRGRLTVYAKWRFLFANESYENEKVDFVASSGSLKQNGVIYSIGDSAESSFVSDVSTGVLAWTSAAAGPSIFVRGSETVSIATMAGYKQVSYRISLASLSGADCMKLQIRVRDNHSTRTQNTLAYVKNGSVYTANGGALLFNLSDSPQEIRVVIDFETLKIYYYNEDGSIITTRAVQQSPYFDSVDDWMESFTGEILSMRCDAAGSIAVGEIYICEGNIFE